MAKAIWLIFPLMGIRSHLVLAGQSKWGRLTGLELEASPNFVNDTFDPWHGRASQCWPNKRPISSQFWRQGQLKVKPSGHQVMEGSHPLLRHISNTYMGLLVWTMMINVDIVTGQPQEVSIMFLKEEICENGRNPIFRLKLVLNPPIAPSWPWSSMLIKA